MKKQTKTQPLDKKIFSIPFGESGHKFFLETHFVKSSLINLKKRVEKTCINWRDRKLSKKDILYTETFNKLLLDLENDFNEEIGKGLLEDNDGNK